MPEPGCAECERKDAALTVAMIVGAIAGGALLGILLAVATEKFRLPRIAFAVVRPVPDYVPDGM